MKSRISEQEAQSSGDGEENEEDFKPALRNSWEKPAACLNAQKDAREGRETPEEGGAGDEAEGGTEGDFDEVDGHEEDGGCAHKLEFRKAAGEEVEGGDGAGRIGEHGGDADEEPARDEESGVLEGDVAEGGPGFVEDHEQGHEENDAADDTAEGIRGDEGHDPPADDDARDGGWEKASNVFPDGVLTEAPD